MRKLEGFSLPFFSCKSKFPRLLVQSWDGKLSLSAEGIQGTGLLYQLKMFPYAVLGKVSVILTLGCTVFGKRLFEISPGTFNCVGMGSCFRVNEINGMVYCEVGEAFAI